MREYTFESFAYFRLRRNETKYISVNSQIGFTLTESWKPIVEWTNFGRLQALKESLNLQYLVTL
jgi:hypothetical protein